MHLKGISAIFRKNFSTFHLVVLQVHVTFCSTRSIYFLQLKKGRELKPSDIFYSTFLNYKPDHQLPLLNYFSLKKV